MIRIFSYKFKLFVNTNGDEEKEVKGNGDELECMIIIKMQQT